MVSNESRTLPPAGSTGQAKRVLINEAHPLQGQLSYSTSKTREDKFAESFYYAYDLPVVTLWPLNTENSSENAKEIQDHHLRCCYPI